MVEEQTTLVREQTTLVEEQTTLVREQTTLDTKQLIAEYLDVVLKTRSTKTHKTYKLALETFARLVQNAPLTTETFTSFLIKSSEMNPSTQALYCSAIIGLYIYASQYLDVNIAALVQARKRYARRRGQRFPVFDKEAIEKIITYCENLKSDELDDLRDRAFVLTLVDTGLRISEACALRRGDIDWNEGRAIIIG
ncbi:MAG: tyrosine-type recombinase/integrase, partial [Anaerolineales bacterium]